MPHIPLPRGAPFAVEAGISLDIISVMIDWKSDGVYSYLCMRVLQHISAQYRTSTYLSIFYLEPIFFNRTPYSSLWMWIRSAFFRYTSFVSGLVNVTFDTTPFDDSFAFTLLYICLLDT